MVRNCFDQTHFPWETGYPDSMDQIGEAFKSINWTAHSHTKYINIDDHKNLTRMLDKLMEMHLGGLEKKIGAVGDLGMITGPFMDLDVFRKFLKPRYKELCDYVKKHSQMKIFFHSCGSIRQFIPDLIEVGFDILNPVQTNCYGRDVLERCEIISRGGGFFFAPIHNILPEVPPENIITAYNAVNEFNGGSSSFA